MEDSTADPQCGAQGVTEHSAPAPESPAPLQQQASVRPVASRPFAPRSTWPAPGGRSGCSAGGPSLPLLKVSEATIPTTVTAAVVPSPVAAPAPAILVRPPATQQQHGARVAFGSTASLPLSPQQPPQQRSVAVAVLQAGAAQHPGHSLSRTTPAGCSPGGCCSPRQARSPVTSKASASPSMPSPRRGLTAAATAVPAAAAASVATTATPQLVLQRLQMNAPGNSANLSQAALSQRLAAIPTPRVGLQISQSVLAQQRSSAAQPHGRSAAVVQPPRPLATMTGAAASLSVADLN